MDVSSLVSAAEELADSPDPIDSTIAVTLCYLVVASNRRNRRSNEVHLARAGHIVANAWESAHSDGVRVIALPILDSVLLLASNGELDLDARDLEEINRSRIRAGEPFWLTKGEM
jgi:hypothetical protein